MNDQRFTPESVARVVRWAIMLFFAFVLLQHVPKFGLGEPPKKIAPVEAKAGLPENSEPKECAGSVFNNFSLFAMPIFPVHSETVAISDIKTGSGNGAACGQKATLRYAYQKRGGDIIFNNMETGEPTRDVLIGGREVIPGLERGIIGMQVGGERDISIPPELGFNTVTHIETLRDHDRFKNIGLGGFLTARATLLSLSPVLPQSALKLRIIEQYLGEGRPVECGDQIAVKLTLWKMDGSILYSNDTGEPLTFTVGGSQLPFGVEQGAIGMMPNGSRTLIIPPAYTAPLNAGNITLLKGVTIPPGEILLAVMQVQPDKKVQASAPVTSSPASLQETVPQDTNRK